MSKVKAASQGWNFAAVCEICNQGYALYRPASDNFVCGLCKKYKPAGKVQEAR